MEKKLFFYVEKATLLFVFLVGILAKEPFIISGMVLYIISLIIVYFENIKNFIKKLLKFKTDI